MKFFKVFLAALLAFVVANMVISLISVMVIAGIVAAAGSESISVKEGSVLRIDLSEAIYDAPPTDPMVMFNFRAMKLTSSTTLFNALTAIDAAALDSNIKGIYISGTNGSLLSLTKAEELRRALIDFKSNSGKFVVAYAPTMSQADYYLCSVADRVLIHPEGGMEWQGLSAGAMFYKGLLAKLGIEPVVLRHGTFKAAVEPFINDKMSPENRLQMSTLVGSMWATMLSEIAISRPKVDSLTLNQYATNLTIDQPAKALELGMVDALTYGNDVKRELLTLMGEIKADAKQEDIDDEDINMVPIATYAAHVKSSVSHVSKNKIALIYADGTITDGQSVEGTIGGESLAAQLAKLRKDDKVRAVVLRINSPGGSALASEIMWHEIELLKAEKPVIISMGSMAASGGYYIACPGDVILTNRTTLTGSIGVFGLLFNVERGMRDKLGVTVDMVRTNPNADLGSPYRAMSKREHDYMMVSVEQVYKTFTSRVAKGRNISVEDVDRIGQGRVWTGADAMNIGLVDGFGGLREAITLAADRAGVIEDFRVMEVADEQGFAAMLKSLGSAAAPKVEGELGELYEHYKSLNAIVNQSGVQALMPYSLDIK